VLTGLRLVRTEGQGAEEERIGGVRTGLVLKEMGMKRCQMMKTKCPKLDQKRGHRLLGFPKWFPEL
jgi:hypothetical protein